MNYKLICSDIDGTLLNKERALSEKTISVIKNIKDRMPVVLISSRMPKAMRHLQFEMDMHHHPLIAYNGGLVLTYDETGYEVLLSIEIPIDLTQRIMHFLSKTSVHMSLYNADDWFVPEMDYWANREMNNTKVTPEVASLQSVCEQWQFRNIGPHKIMCMGDENEIQQLEDWLNLHHTDQVHAYRSKSTYLEIASKKISKLSALSYLLDDRFDIRLSEVMAFGDNYNDIELIRGVGLGVAMANAKDAVKAISDRVTLSNLDDGVAVAIEEYLKPSFLV